MSRCQGWKDFGKAVGIRERYKRTPDYFPDSVQRQVRRLCCALFPCVVDSLKPIEPENIDIEGGSVC